MPKKLDLFSSQENKHQDKLRQQYFDHQKLYFFNYKDIEHLIIPSFQRTFHFRNAYNSDYKSANSDKSWESHYVKALAESPADQRDPLWIEIHFRSKAQKRDFLKHGGLNNYSYIKRILNDGYKLNIKQAKEFESPSKYRQKLNEQYNSYRGKHPKVSKKSFINGLLEGLYAEDGHQRSGSAVDYIIHNREDLETYDKLITKCQRIIYGSNDHDIQHRRNVIHYMNCIQDKNPLDYQSLLKSMLKNAHVKYDRKSLDTILVEALKYSKKQKALKRKFNKRHCALIDPKCIQVPVLIMMDDPSDWKSVFDAKNLYRQQFAYTEKVNDTWGYYTLTIPTNNRFNGKRIINDVRQYQRHVNQSYKNNLLPSSLKNQIELSSNRITLSSLAAILGTAFANKQFDNHDAYLYPLCHITKLQRVMNVGITIIRTLTNNATDTEKMFDDPRHAKFIKSHIVDRLITNDPKHHNQLNLKLIFLAEKAANDLTNMFDEKSTDINAKDNDFDNAIHISFKDLIKAHTNVDTHQQQYISIPQWPVLTYWADIVYCLLHDQTSYIDNHIRNVKRDCVLSLLFTRRWNGNAGQWPGVIMLHNDQYNFKSHNPNDYKEFTSRCKRIFDDVDSKFKRHQSYYRFDRYTPSELNTKVRTINPKNKKFFWIFHNLKNSSDNTGEIEHIIPVDRIIQLEKHLNVDTHAITMPTSVIGNLMILPESINKSKGNQTLYEYIHHIKDALQAIKHGDESKVRRIRKAYFHGIKKSEFNDSYLRSLEKKCQRYLDGEDSNYYLSGNKKIQKFAKKLFNDLSHYNADFTSVRVNGKKVRPTTHDLKLLDNRIEYYIITRSREVMSYIAKSIFHTSPSELSNDSNQ